MRTEFLEIYLASLDKAWAAKVKKEECFKDLKGDRRERFLQAIRKEIQNNMDTKAYKMLSPEESERVRREAAEKIVKSRFVLTEKNIELTTSRRLRRIRRSLTTRRWRKQLEGKGSACDEGIQRNVGGGTGDHQGPHLNVDEKPFFVCYSCFAVTSGLPATWASPKLFIVEMILNGRSMPHNHMPVLYQDINLVSYSTY